MTVLIALAAAVLAGAGLVLQQPSGRAGAQGAFSAAAAVR
jgi:archaellin